MMGASAMATTPMLVTLNLPDDLAAQLNALQGQLPQILQLGLRELHASPQAGFSGIADIVEFLASLPTPEEILALRPSAALQAQISDLLEKSRNPGLSPDEERL